MSSRVQQPSTIDGSCPTPRFCPDLSVEVRAPIVDLRRVLPHPCFAQYGAATLDRPLEVSQ